MITSFNINGQRTNWFGVAFSRAPSSSLRIWNLLLNFHLDITWKVHYIKWKFHWYFTIALESIQKHITNKTEKKSPSSSSSDADVCCVLERIKKNWREREKIEKKGSVMNESESFSRFLFVHSDLCGGWCVCLMRPSSSKSNQSNFSHKICISFWIYSSFLFVVFF